MASFLAFSLFLLSLPLLTGHAAVNPERLKSSLENAGNVVEHLIDKYFKEDEPSPTPPKLNTSDNRLNKSQVNEFCLDFINDLESLLGQDATFTFFVPNLTVLYPIPVRTLQAQPINLLSLHTLPGHYSMESLQGLPHPLLTLGGALVRAKNNGVVNVSTTISGAQVGRVLFDTGKLIAYNIEAVLLVRDYPAGLPPPPATVDQPLRIFVVLGHAPPCKIMSENINGTNVGNGSVGSGSIRLNFNPLHCFTLALLVMFYAPFSGFF